MTARLALLTLACTIQLLAYATPGLASDHPPLSDWPVSISSGPVDIRDNDGRGWQEPGRWSAHDIRRGSDGHLRFTLHVTPAPVRLPVRAGPAVLFVGVGLSGDAGGDMGYERTVRVTRQAAPACRREPCTYRFDVDADLSVLPAAAAAAPIEPGVSAQVGFTLVRTFGSGTWLQVMDTFEPRPRRVVQPGRPIGGRIATMGLVPAHAAEGWSAQREDGPIDLARRVARSVRGLPDGSRPLPTVRVRLAIDAPGCWPYLRLAIHDEQGARPLDGDLLELDPSGTVVEVPDGLPWTVSLWEGGIFDGDVSVPSGSFTTAGEDLDVTARFACGDEPGSYTGSLTVAPATGPLPDPTALRTVEWTPALEGPRHGNRRLPFTVTGTPKRFLALGWDPDEGWLEWSSRDAVRWRRRSIPSADGLPSPPDLLDVRLWSVDRTARLTTIVALPAGPRQVRVWRRTSPGRWSSEGGLDSGLGAGPLPASFDAGSVGAFVGHGDDALLLLLPDADASTGPARLLRSGAAGEWQVVGPAEGTLTSVVSTADGFAMSVRTTGPSGSMDTLLTSADGVAWSEAGTLPSGASGPPQLAVADGTLLVFSSDETGMTRGWRREPDGSWTSTLLALGTLFPGSVAASGRMVTLLTRIDGWSTFTAGAVSLDGGRTWDRNGATDDSSETCRMSLAVSPPIAVTGAGGCDAWVAATRWTPSRMPSRSWATGE